mgnify:CR=1 FL=1
MVNVSNVCGIVDSPEIIISGDVTTVAAAPATVIAVPAINLPTSFTTEPIFFQFQLSGFHQAFLLGSILIIGVMCLL